MGNKAVKPVSVTVGIRVRLTTFLEMSELAEGEGLSISAAGRMLIEEALADRHTEGPREHTDEEIAARDAARKG